MFKQLIKALTTLVIILLTSACGPKKPFVDYDNNTDFSQIKTYQWNLAPSAEYAKANPLLHKRITNAINKGLQNKGFTLSDSADVTISYSISIEKTLSSGGLSGGIGLSVGKSNRGHISLSSGNQLRQTTEGTLLIDMSSNPANTLIWRSGSTQKITGKASSPQESIDYINAMVNLMLDEYPPVKGNSQ